MARIKKGILGGVNGTIGNVVGGRWKGIEYIRTKPAHITDAKSDKQIEVRSKFLTVIRFLQPLTEMIRVGYQSLAIKKSAFNAATSYHFKNAVVGEVPDECIDMTKVVLAMGNLTGAENPAVSSTQAAQLSLSWEDNSGIGSAADEDIALLAVIDPLDSQVYYSMNAGKRSDSGSEVNLPASFSGKEVHSYLFFARLSSSEGGSIAKSCSKSVYLGSVQVV